MAETENKTSEVTPAPIRFTDACVAKVKELLAEEENPDMPLRVFVQGGGCQGFQYGFQFEEAKEADDTVIERDGVTFLPSFIVKSGKRLYSKSFLSFSL